MYKENPQISADEWINHMNKKFAQGEKDRNTCGDFFSLVFK